MSIPGETQGLHSTLTNRLTSKRTGGSASATQDHSFAQNRPKVTRTQDLLNGLLLSLIVLHLLFVKCGLILCFVGQMDQYVDQHIK